MPVTLVALDKARRNSAGRTAGAPSRLPSRRPARGGVAQGDQSGQARRHRRHGGRGELSGRRCDGSAWRHRSFAPAWAKTPVGERAATLRPRRRPLRGRMPNDFFALATARPARRCPDGVAEVREAVDFLRYYARRAALRSTLPGPASATSSLRAASSSASRRGTSRSPSSPARSRRPWSPATRSSPSRPSRRR
jgi:delta 1-pyrroline-5-carboxylate dehydrogenase